MAFVVAAVGSAVGLGNIWKFPYMISEYGGGVFIVTYLFCIVVIGLPILIAEINLGFLGNANPVNAIANLAKGRPGGRAWTVIGYSGIVAAFLILSFYMVICGWVCSYLFNIATLTEAEPAMVSQAFDELSSNPGRQFFWHSVMIWVTALIMSGGIRSTVETVFEMMMPLLGALMLALLIYTFVDGQAVEALDFMFSFDISLLTGEIFIQAMGQAFFTLSLGMGAIMVFGSYLPKNASVVRAACVVAAADTLVALSAAVIVYSLVLQQGMSVSNAGPGLVFKTLPIVFAQIPGGAMVGSIFFFILLLAAISSAMSLLEPLICYMSENYKLTRRQISLSVGFIIWLLGIPTIYSFTDNFSPFSDSSTWFEQIDFLSSSILLPVGGILIALFSSWVIAEGPARQSLGLSKGIYTVYIWLIRTIAPLAILFILGNFLINALSS